eukprot:147681-Pleurochrysis_carterae.AAC.2
MQSFEQNSLRLRVLQGVSRSSSMVIAYLMWDRGLSFDEAFKHVKARAESPVQMTANSLSRRSPLLSPATLRSHLLLLSPNLSAPLSRCNLITAVVSPPRRASQEARGVANPNAGFLARLIEFGQRVGKGANCEGGTGGKSSEPRLHRIIPWYIAPIAQLVEGKARAHSDPRTAIRAQRSAHSDPLAAACRTLPPLHVTCHTM